MFRTKKRTEKKVQRWNHVTVCWLFLLFFMRSANFYSKQFGTINGKVLNYTQIAVPLARRYVAFTHSVFLFILLLLHQHTSGERKKRVATTKRISRVFFLSSSPSILCLYRCICIQYTPYKRWWLIYSLSVVCRFILFVFQTNDWTWQKKPLHIHWTLSKNCL